MIACAPNGAGFEQDCRVCRSDPDARARWGCEKPLDQPWMFIEPCPRCHGADPKCIDCKGENKAPIFRCPRALVTQREIDAVGAAILAEQGVLPNAGGWQDQAATFVAAFPLLCAEIAHWRSVAQQRAIERSRQKQR